MAQKRRTFTLYSSSSTTTFTSSVDSPVEPEKPDWGQDKLRRHPPVLHMVLEALRATQHPRGTSVAAIKVYIMHKYPTVDFLRLKYLLRQALATGISRGLLTRPANSKARGATGSFKLVPKPTKKIQTKKTCPKTVPKNPGEAKEQDPKRPGKAKKDLPSPGQAKKDPRKLGEHKASLPKPGAAKDKPPRKASETKKGLSKPGQGQRGPQKASEGKGAHVKPSTAEKAPQNGSQTKGSKAPQHPGKASKAPQHPGKASKTPPSGKSTAAGGRTQPGADVHRKTKVKNRSSKPTSSKSKNGAVSPSGKEVKSQGPGQLPKAKA
ncbi:histone H1.8 [Sorex fumeus]|uniref:histone H1.8 n=1 Tax=Sorex fumeus TaxID=62283 RepID=UPI0024AC9BE4|nr:histone H1.8 [Sorex fumeus]